MPLRKLALGYSMLAVLAASCGDSGSNDDAGGPDAGDATTQPDTASGDTGGGDVISTTDAANDAGDAASDSGTITLACGGPVRVDTLAGVSGSDNPALEAAAYGSKYVAMWEQVPQVTGDGQVHLKARAFNGTSFENEVDFGATNGKMRMASDGAGRAFAQWSASSMVRSVFDFSTLAFGAATPFGNVGFTDRTDVASAGAGSALSAYYQANNTFAADRWYADGGWTSTGLALATGAPFETRLISNTTGQAVLGWYTGTATFHAVPYDGGGWAAEAQTTQDGGSTTQQYVVLSNGDALYMFLHTGEVQTSRFDAASETFGAPVTVEALAGVTQGSTARHQMVVDSVDRVTIVWTRAVSAVSHAFVSRSFDKGATWTQPADLGAADSAMLALDPATSNVIVATRDKPTSTGIVLRATTPTGTTWTAPAQTNLQANSNGNYSQLDHQARIVFGASGAIVIAHQYEPDAGLAYTVQAVTCTL